jgi:Lrp/AsnC family leucine-responsive transcriptional regulator
MPNSHQDRDKRLLKALQQLGGKSTYQQLAIEAETSEATAARRVHEWEHSGVIRGYAVDIDPARIGLRPATFVVVKLRDYDELTLNQFRKLLQEDNRITECYSVMGEHDYILRMYFQDDTAYTEFIQMLLDSPLFLYTTTYQTIKIWKPPHPLPLDKFGTT